MINETCPVAAKEWLIKRQRRWPIFYRRRFLSWLAPWIFHAGSNRLERAAVFQLAGKRSKVCALFCIFRHNNQVLQGSNHVVAFEVMDMHIQTAQRGWKRDAHAASHAAFVCQNHNPSKADAQRWNKCSQWTADTRTHSAGKILEDLKLFATSFEIRSLMVRS